MTTDDRELSGVAAEKLTVFLRSGATVTFRAGHFSLVKNALGELKSLKWEGEINPYPLWLDLTEAVVVVVEDD